MMLNSKIEQVERTQTRREKAGNYAQIENMFCLFIFLPALYLSGRKIG